MIEYPPGTEIYDTPDLPPSTEWGPWDFLNRLAELGMLYARFWGLL